MTDRTDESCISEKEFGMLVAKVEQLEKETTTLFEYLKDHMTAEESRFVEFNNSLVAIKLTMARWMGGGVVLMVISDWVLRSGMLH